jgi:hypothetical protein
VNRASTTGDAMGQQFRTASAAIAEQRNDIVIVGRGVTDAATADEMLTRVQDFKAEAWTALVERDA